MYENNVVVQIVRKIQTEGYNWLLLEKKDPLDKPLELKNSQSHSRSLMEYQTPGRKLFWVCEEALKEDLLDYVYSYTPAFLINSGSLKIELGDLFTNKSEAEGYNSLKENTIKLYQKRSEIIKELKEIKLDVNPSSFLTQDVLSTELTEKLHDLEYKNTELFEENSELKLRNTELMITANLTNIRLKELNKLVYDFSKDKPQEDYIKTNALLITEIDEVKADQTLTEIELNKLKERIRERKSRLNKGEKGKQGEEEKSFEFDGEGDLFGNSFLIDTSNKEMEDKLEKHEEQIKVMQEELDRKQEIIESLQATIEETGQEHGKLFEQRKSESFEMMNSENIKHIKDVLFKFLKKIPYSEQSNEALLEIVFSMLLMSEEEIKSIKDSRDTASGIKHKGTPSKDDPKKKGSIFSRLLH